MAQGILRGLLDAPDARGLDPRDRALVTELFYGVLRWRLRLDAVISRFAKKGVPSDPELANILRMGTFQLLLLDRIPARAAIHSSVSMARKIRGDHVGRFVNGVLRTVDRERPEPADLAERWAHPQWLVERFRAEVGEQHLEARLEANMTRAPMDLRLHPDEPGPVPEDAKAMREGIRNGRWIPQDRASQAVVELLAPAPGERVLELCGGRGVKTTQLASAIGPNGFLVGLDASAPRLAEARRLLQGWCPQVPLHLICADVTRPLPIDPSLRFDRILVDAPCSGLGVIRRRPETLWRRQPGDIAVLAGMQRAMLTEAERWLAPGGTLVYAVCTTTPEETTAVVADRPVIRTVATTPDVNGTDGFFSALIQHQR